MGAPLPDDALLQTLLELLPAGVMVLGASGALAFANPAASAPWPSPLRTGVPPRLPPGTRWASGGSASPADWAGERALTERIPVLGQALWMTDATGRERFVVHSAIPVRGGGGVEGAVVLLQDLTEIKALEVRHAAVLSSMGEALVCLDDRTRITLVNRAAEALLGHTASRLVGAELSVIVDPPERGALGEALAGPQGPVTLRTRLRRAGGEPLDAEVTASHFPFDGQQLHTLLLRDLTERNRMEGDARLLSEAGELLSSTLDERSAAQDVVRLLVRSGRASVALVDAQRPDGSWTRLAAAASPPEHEALVRALEAQPVPAAGLAEDPEALRDLEPRLYAGAGGDLVARSTSLSTRRLLERLGIGCALGLPLRARGRARGALWVMGRTGALSARDLCWAGLLASRAALALDNAWLYERAQAAAREKEQLVGMVAHELRNPISTCRMAAALVRRALPAHPDLALRAAANAERASLRADQLIRDLLESPSGKSGGWLVRDDVLSAAALLPELDALVEGLNQGARWKVVLAPGLPGIRADAGRLLQVLGNLVSNAFRHVPSGGTVRLDVTAGADTVQFRVSDDGPGIPPSLYPHLFQRGATAAPGGNGFGLYLARQLVEAMGGQIHAEPPSGAGAVFTFTLPAAGTATHAPADA